MKKYFLFILFLISCKPDASFEKNLEIVAQKKNAVASINVLDLTSQIHSQAITDYFRIVGDLALALKTDERFSSYWAELIESGELSAFCSKFVLTPSEWKNLNDQCTIEGHYLCPDELKEYPKILKLILKNSGIECSKWF